MTTAVAQPLYLDPSYQISRGWSNDPHVIESDAEAGDLQAQLLLGYLFTNVNDERYLSVANAYPWYERAVKEHDSIDGLLLMAEMKEGAYDGIERSLNTACDYYAKVLLHKDRNQLSEASVTNVMRKYGFYLLGAKSPVSFGPQLSLSRNKQDATKGLAWLEEAGARGNVDSSAALGNYYTTAVAHPYVVRNTSRGKYWFAKAAEAGKADCAYQLAMLYKIGIDEPSNEKMQLKWLQVAATMGHHKAMQGLKEENGRHKATEDFEQNKKHIPFVKCFNPSCQEKEGTGRKRFSLCARCQHAKYCSKECQKFHFHCGHKWSCKMEVSVLEICNKLLLSNAAEENFVTHNHT